LIVILGDFVSSIKYRVFIDGKAINNRRTAGRIVQIVSISWPSIMNLLKDLLIMMDVIRYNVMIVIKIKIIIEWS